MAKTVDTPLSAIFAWLPEVKEAKQFRRTPLLSQHKPTVGKGVLATEFSPEEVLSVALLVLRLPQDLAHPVRMETGETGTEWLVKEAAEEQEGSVHILASLPILVLQEAEAALLLKTLQSTPIQPRLLPIRLALEPQTSCLAVPVALEQLL